MSSLVTTFVIVGIVGSLLVITFSEQIKAVVLDVLIKIVSENAAKPPPNLKPPPAEEPAPPPAEPKWVPPGFQGPSGEPRIIGPGGNPPNY